MADGLFDSLNSSGENLEFLVGNSPQELLEMIRQIRLPLNIVSIYAIGSKHIAWFQTSARIIKKKKDK